MRRFLYLFLVTLFVFGATEAFGQRLDRRLKEDDEQKRGQIQPLRLSLDQKKELDKKKLEEPEQMPSAFQLQSQPLEAAIDPEKYIIGPGDMFQITIWAAENLSFNLPVVPEGKLIIPTIGTLDVDRKTLSAVKQMIATAAARKYLNTEITANLVRIRQVRVHVTGQILEPGPYLALATHRVSDVIEAADGLTSVAAERNVELRHKDGSVELVDLHRYYQNGDLENNPFVDGGDVVHVPAINFSQATVRVEGMVPHPGEYQIAANESVADFLLRVNAYNRDSDLRAAYITRNSTGNGTAETIPVFPYLRNQGNGHSELYLQAGDVISVPDKQEEVYVIGAVRNPGPFAFYPRTKAFTYVGFAGSHERAADLSDIEIIRKNSEDKLKGKDITVKPGDTIFVPQRTEFGVREITTIVGTAASILLTMKAIGVIK